MSQNDSKSVRSSLHTVIIVLMLHIMCTIGIYAQLMYKTCYSKSKNPSSKCTSHKKKFFFSSKQLKIAQRFRCLLQLIYILQMYFNALQRADSNKFISSKYLEITHNKQQQSDMPNLSGFQIFGPYSNLPEGVTKYLFDYFINIYHVSIQLLKILTKIKFNSVFIRIQFSSKLLKVAQCG